jgi:chromosome segregation ATPase
MSPEMMIAVGCAASGLCLVLGGMLLGGRGASEQDTSDGDDAALKFKLEQIEASKSELRKKMDAERSSLEMKVTAAKLERDRFSAELDKALKSRDSGASGNQPTFEELAQLRDRAFKAEQERDLLEKQLKERGQRTSVAPAGHDPEVKQAREELERLRQEVSRQEARIAGLQASVEKGAAELERLTAERDEARERKEAADRIIEAVRARSAGLQQQLKDAQAELATLRG